MPFYGPQVDTLSILFVNCGMVFITKNWNMKNLFFCSIFCLLFIMCSKVDDDKVGQHLLKESEASLTLTTKQTAMVHQNNAFAFRLLNSMAKVNVKSFLFSPLSTTYALGMAAQGAVGTTRDEIINTLGMGGSQDELNRFCMNLLYRSLYADPEVTIQNANIALVNNGTLLTDEFSSALADYYDALSLSLDLRNVKATVEYINNWASKHTDGIIPRLLTDKMTDELQGDIYLLNSMAFAGKWSCPFSDSEIEERLFNKTNVESSMIPMLTRTEILRYSETETETMIQLPYGQGKYIMSFILPEADISIDDYLQHFSIDTWTSLTRESFRTERVHYAFPTFETQTETLLEDILEEMGIQVAFHGSADFSNMTKTKVSLSKIFQSCKINVDEKGTLAASATAAVINEVIDGEEDQRKIFDFTADRPFMYVISDTETDTIFFIGCFRG